MKTLITIIFISILNFAIAQKPTDPIQLDRPDQTECPFITPIKYIQAENGINVEKEGNSITTLVVPTILWKYGINSNFELRLITEVNSIIKPEIKQTGFLPVTIGFKANLFKEKGIIPLTSFIGHITTAKTGHNDFNSKFIAPSFRFTMQHTLSDNATLAYNLGTEWDGETAFPTYIYTLTNGIGLGEKTGFYYEIYGFIPQNKKAEHLFDCGFTYLLNYDIMCDISGGAKFDDISTNYLSLGFSYRFLTKKSRT